MRPVASCATLEDVDVECTHCGVRMSANQASGSRVRYFHCAQCHRWVTSSYTEVFKADVKVRAHPRRVSSVLPGLDQVKGRLERWLNALDDQDPYRALGVSPMETPERIRERYRELALAHHPDRGGSPDAMQRINDAYERIVQHRERRRVEALGGGVEVQGLPTGA